MNLTSRVTILVKALPQPSKRYIETVCCAGVDSLGKWKRLYPVRFRLLEGKRAFSRWDIVEFDYSHPKTDTRKESCHIFEDRIRILNKVTSKTQRSNLLNSILIGSEYQAREKGMSLALVEPHNIKFRAKKRSIDEISELQSRYARLNKQASLFDPALETFKPSPFEFSVDFEDLGGKHSKKCGDWEVYAMFRKFSRLFGEKEALEKMDHTFNVEYPNKGVLFALGNLQSRPQTFQLLGMIRVDKIEQLPLI